MNEESGGFGSGAVQMKALPSSGGTAAVSGVAKDGTKNLTLKTNFCIPSKIIEC